MSDLEKVIADAPPGVIMHGTITLHKVPVGGKEQIWMVCEYGEETLRKQIPPAFIKAVSGKGPMAKVLGKLFGGGPEIEGGPGGKRSME